MSSHKRAVYVFAALLLTIVAVLIVPLPPWLLDLLLGINVFGSALVLLLSVTVDDPLEFSAFAPALLIATLFRLSLDVSATRLILTSGATPGAVGAIIPAFGAFVVGGNLVVGLIVFAILVTIQFVVIASGSQRVAEVAARFTLDAMPGKQMAIDADVHAGALDADGARCQARSRPARGGFLRSDGRRRKVRERRCDRFAADCGAQSRRRSSRGRCLPRTRTARCGADLRVAVDRQCARHHVAGFPHIDGDGHDGDEGRIGWRAGCRPRDAALCAAGRVAQRGWVTAGARTGTRIAPAALFCFRYERVRHGRTRAAKSPARRSRSDRCARADKAQRHAAPRIGARPRGRRCGGNRNRRGPRAAPGAAALRRLARPHRRSAQGDGRRYRRRASGSASARRSFARPAHVRHSRTRSFSRVRASRSRSAPRRRRRNSSRRVSPCRSNASRSISCPRPGSRPTCARARQTPARWSSIRFPCSVPTWPRSRAPTRPSSSDVKSFTPCSSTCDPPYRH